MRNIYISLSAILLTALTFISSNLSAQNVGIGESSPTVKLDIKGSNGHDLLNIKDDQGTSRLYVQENGKTGIGTSSAASKLDVKGAITVGNNYAGSSQAPANGALFEGIMGIGVTNVPSESNLVLGAVTGSVEGGQIQLNAAAGSNNDQAFFLDNYKDQLRVLHGTNSGSSGRFMTIDSSGDVGIGGQSPTTKLDVDGQIRVRGGSPSTNDVLATSSTNGTATWQDPDNLIDDDYLPNDPATSDVDMNSKNINNVSKINMASPGRIRTEGTASIEMYDDNNGYRIASFKEGGDVTVMNGNIGVGASSPDKKLDIRGTAKITKDIIGDEDNRLNIYSNSSAGNSRTWIEMWGQDNVGNRDGELAMAGTYISLRTNSDASSSGTENVRIENNGDVGFGTSSPAGKFEVNDGNLPKMKLHTSDPSYTPSDYVSSGLGSVLELGRGSNDYGTMQWYTYQTSGGSNRMAFSSRGDIAFLNNGSEKMRIKANGQVGIGTNSPNFKLDVNGQINSDGITETSDQRFKKEITTLDNALSKIDSLRGVHFHWDDEAFPNREFDNKEHIGVIAQEVEKVLPALVNTDNEGYKSVEYTKLVPVLIEAIKEQQKIIDKQNKQDRKQQQQIQELKEAVHALKENNAQNNFKAEQ